MDDIKKVEGDPTKGFFIDMLTRDILLSDAIFDLVDNSIDGARKIRGNDLLNGLWVQIILEKDLFSIADNCGGFSLEVATKYAFRFGRPEQFRHQNNNSIGRFGIGMKRALFKIGSKFSVKSKNGSDEFEVSADLDEWIHQQDWGFNINTNIDNQFTEDGTKIHITQLHESVSQDLNDDRTLNRLIMNLEKTYYAILEKGMTISVNGRMLSPEFIKLYDNEEVSPSVELIEGEKFSGKIIAGIAETNPTKAGWYIFCNDRLVVEADKTPLTGWGGRDDETGHGMVYHNNYAMFRGLVYLEADDPFDLPLTTTKSGLDWDSNVYKFIKLKMINAIKEIAPIIRNIKELEIDEELLSDPEFTIYSNIQSTNYNEKKPFVVVKKKLVKTTSRIQYDINIDKLNDAKKLTGENTNKAVGLATFNYFMDMEN